MPYLSALDDDIIEDAPLDPIKEASDAGLRFTLTEAVFSRWWKSIPAEYRDEFVSVHHGCPEGSLDLPRFVCALDHLLIQQNRAHTAGLIMDAWLLATKGPENHETGRAASEAWKHDAVQQLLYRIRNLQSKQAAGRIERLLTANLESDLLSGDQKKRDAAVKNGLAFMRLVAERETAEVEARTRSGAERLKGDMEEAKRAFTRPTEDQAKEYMKALVEMYGPKAFLEILNGAIAIES